MKKTLSRIVATIGASLLAGSILAAPAMAAPSETTPAPLQLSAFVPMPEEPPLEEITKNLSDAELELLESGAPSITYQEVGTGEITKVEKLSEMEAFVLLPTTNCSGSSITGCLHGGGTPYPDYGFTGVGTLGGTWTHRTGYGSQTKYMRACDAYTCYSTKGPKQLLVFSQPTTVKSVRIS